MHMWWWFGYDLGEFLFPGLDVETRWSFSLTWIVLFVVSILFEGSKVYLARLQKEAQRKLFKYRSDERRNLLCQHDRDQASTLEATTSRSTSTPPVSRWTSFKMRMLVNIHQATVFLLHNTVGYILMLAVMIYNVQLLFSVVLGMMLGHFLFGTKLTRLQMQCFGTKRVVVCTPDCDDTAETTTPPLLDSSIDSETDAFTCQTRTCIQPSHYFPAAAQGEPGCHYGAKSCPSKVARAKKLKNNTEVEETRLLKHKTSCCNKNTDRKCCSKTSSQVEILTVHSEKEKGCCKKKADEGSEAGSSVTRESSPPVSCCHQMKVPSDSQEQIL